MSSSPPQDNHRLATLFALGVAVVLPCVDAMVKLLVVDYPVVMVAWVRMGLIALVLGAIGGSQIGMRMLRPTAWRLQTLRGAAAVLGYGDGVSRLSRHAAGRVFGDRVDRARVGQPVLALVAR